MLNKLQYIPRIKAKIIFFLLINCFFVLITRVFFLQFISEDRLEKKAFSQHSLKKILAPMRGSILDANNVPLAISVNVYTVKAAPSEISDIDNVAKKLSLCLGLSPRVLRRKLKNNSKAVYLKRKMFITVYVKSR